MISKVDIDSNEITTMEKEGLTMLDKVAICILPDDKIDSQMPHDLLKLSLPVVCIEEKYSFMKFYAEYVLACQMRCKEINAGQIPDDWSIPLCIVVYEDH